MSKIFFLSYQIYGIIWYLTFSWYSLYPFNFFSKTSSSFLILLIIISGYIKNITNEINEPKIIFTNYLIFTLILLTSKIGELTNIFLLSKSIVASASYGIMHLGTECPKLILYKTGVFKSLNTFL